MTNPNYFVITGGPGVGKTTLLEELQKRHFTCVPEAARQLIKEQVFSGGDALPWMNKELYLQMMFDRSVDHYREVINKSGVLIFFDRGIPDSLTYAEILGTGISKKMDHSARQFRYNQKIFFLSPWKEIYTKDEERKQSWEEAVKSANHNADIYKRYDYALIDVPNNTVEKRADFILKNIGEEIKAR